MSTENDIIELMTDLLEWYDKQNPSDLCTVHPPAGSGCGPGLYNLPTKEVVLKFMRSRGKKVVRVQSVIREPGNI